MDALPVFVKNWTECFSTKWLSCIARRAPIFSNTPCVSGISDSPILKTGTASRSSSSVRSPPRAAIAAAAEPPGPAPITITS